MLHESDIHLVFLAFNMTSYRFLSLHKILVGVQLYWPNTKINLIAHDNLDHTAEWFGINI